MSLGNVMEVKLWANAKEREKFENLAGVLHGNAGGRVAPPSRICCLAGMRSTATLHIFC